MTESTIPAPPFRRWDEPRASETDERPKLEHGEPTPRWVSFQSDDLDQTIPPEYRGAELSEAIKAILFKREPSMTLIGPPGTGKTRMLWALKRHQLMYHGADLLAAGGFWQRGEQRHGVWGFVSKPKEKKAEEIRAMGTLAIISESGDILRNRFDRTWLDDMAGHNGILAIDDIGFTNKANEWTTEAIYHLANERRAWKRRTIWTTNLRADDLRSMYGAAIASRILGGEVIEIDGKDKRVS